jgi:hypothetical protein
MMKEQKYNLWDKDTKEWLGVGRKLPWESFASEYIAELMGGLS